MEPAPCPGAPCLVSTHLPHRAVVRLNWQKHLGRAEGHGGICSVNTIKSKLSQMLSVLLCGGIRVGVHVPPGSPSPLPQPPQLL